MTYEVSAGFTGFNKAADNNRHAILAVLREQCRTQTGQQRVLEIGSGSGQHAVFFAESLPGVTWQPSDCGPWYPGLVDNLARVSLPNLLPPLYLDAADFQVEGSFTAVYCANVFHIMPATLIEPMFAGVGGVLETGGQFLVYGPFRYEGAFTTASNQQFDDWLRRRNPDQGIRDIERLIAAAADVGMTLTRDIAMPANNQMLVFRAA